MALTKISSDLISSVSSSTLTGALPVLDGSSLTGVDSGLQSVQVFTASGTWSKPSGISKVIIEVQGAGGSGSRHNSSTNYMCPGIAGGYAKKFLDVSAISTSTITVGSGGATASSQGAGSAGGNSSWADGTNTITGNGGSGGSSSYHGGNAGASASGGDINISSSGYSGYLYNANSGGSMFGFGAFYNTSGETNYPDASGYGAAGSSGYNSNSGTGAGGIVIVWEYK